MTGGKIIIDLKHRLKVKVSYYYSTASLLILTRKINFVLTSLWIDIERMSNVSLLTSQLFSPLLMISGISMNFCPHLFGNKNNNLIFFMIRIIKKMCPVYTSRHLFINTIYMNSLGNFSLLTGQSCTALDILIVKNFNIICLILVGVFRKSFSYIF